MVDLLNAPAGTKLHQRLEKENRLIKKISGDYTDMSINFRPKMEYETLIRGYKHILNSIYSPKGYYERIYAFLREYRPASSKKASLSLQQVIGITKSVWIIGFKQKGRTYYWKLLLWSLFRRPEFFALSVTLAICGYHFRRIANHINSLPETSGA